MKNAALWKAYSIAATAEVWFTLFGMTALGYLTWINKAFHKAVALACEIDAFVIDAT